MLSVIVGGIGGFIGGMSLGVFGATIFGAGFGDLAPMFGSSLLCCPPGGFPGAAPGVPVAAFSGAEIFCNLNAYVECCSQWQSLPAQVAAFVVRIGE